MLPRWRGFSDSDTHTHTHQIGLKRLKAVERKKCTFVKSSVARKCGSSSQNIRFNFPGDSDSPPYQAFPRDLVLPSVGLSHQDLWLLSIAWASIRSSQQGNGKFDFELDYLAVLSLLALFTSLAHLSVGNLFASNFDSKPGTVILVQENNCNDQERCQSVNNFTAKRKMLESRPEDVLCALHSL